MLWVVELWASDGTKRVRVFDNAGDAHAVCNEIELPEDYGLPSESGSREFWRARASTVEAANPDEAMAALQSGGSKLIRDTQSGA